jgi:VWFA-related protein
MLSSTRPVEPWKSQRTLGARSAVEAEAQAPVGRRDQRRRVGLSQALLVGGFLSALAVQFPAGQERPADQTPTFRARTDVVQLDVSVLDHQGQPVRGLAAADFTVLKDGRAQPIVAFTAIDVPTWTSATATWMREIGQDVATNRLDARRAVVIVMDDVNKTPANDPLTPLAKKIALATIDGLGPADLAAVVHVLNRDRGQEFTLDRTRLRASVDRFVASADRFPDSPFAASWGRGVQGGGAPSGACYLKDCVAECLYTAGQVLAAWPGARKTVVLISAGRQHPGIEETQAEADERRRMFTALQTANVTVYQFDPHGLQTSVPPLTDFGTLAEATGGRTVTNTNAPQGQVSAMFRENSSYYILGLRADDNADGRFHRLRVTVNRPDVQVRTRAGYFSDKRPRTKPNQPSDLERALSGGLPAGDLPVSVSAAPFATAGKPGAALALVARLDHDATLAGEAVIELVAAAFNTNWKQVAGATQRFVLRPSNVGARFSETTLRLNLPPGRYEVRTAMRNTADGRTGSVFTSVTVPDFNREPLSLSGLEVESLPGGAAALEDLAGVVPEVRMTTVRQFSGEQQAAVVVRVYQRRTKTLTPVRLGTRIVDGQDRAVFTTEAVLEPAAFNAERLADYRVDLPLGRLSDGEYLLTLEASIASTVVRRNLRFTVRRERPMPEPG